MKAEYVLKHISWMFKRWWASATYNPYTTADDELFLNFPYLISYDKFKLVLKCNDFSGSFPRSPASAPFHPLLELFEHLNILVGLFAPEHSMLIDICHLHPTLLHLAPSSQRDLHARPTLSLLSSANKVELPQPIPLLRSCELNGDPDRQYKEVLGAYKATIFGLR
jgi:hypothetical protein